MLLLLRSPPSGVAAANLGINFGLSGIAGPLASLSLILDLAPPNAVEVNLSAGLDVHFGITAISSGFLSRTATVDASLGLSASPAFTASPSLGLTLGLSGTVGSFLQNSATLAVICGVTGQVTALPAATLGTILGISGLPIISGGTLTPSASLGTMLGLSIGQAVFASNGSMSVSINLTATGTQFGQAANLPQVPYISGLGPWDVTIRTYA